MNSREAELNIRQQLAGIYDESEAANIAAMLIENITGLSRSGRIMKNEMLTAGQNERMDQIIQRLQHHEPIQYILGEAWFAGMKLYVDKNVLIPRPETEELVQWIIDDVKKQGLGVFERQPAEADVTQELKIIDIGTGSGCIALGLKKTMPLAEVWGCDVSEEALNVARRNGSVLDIRVDFQNANFLDVVQQKHLPSVDIVVSNPPYIPQSDQQTMQPNVLHYEPHTALFVPNDDALVFYKALIEFGKNRLHAKGKIYMEIHEDLGNEVMQLFTDAGYKAELKKDMQGKDRMVKATK